jgi:hypothetical protein
MYLGQGRYIRGWKCLSHIVGDGPSPLAQESVYVGKVLAARGAVIQASCNRYSMSPLWKIYVRDTRPTPSRLQVFGVLALSK